VSAFALALAPWRWLQRLRRELRAELRPLPTPRGFVNTSLLDPERWERLPPGAVAHAARNVVRAADPAFAIIAPALPNGHAAGLHLSLSDSTGDSAILEYVDGKLVIHHGPQY
jgi:hypothetical protein